MPSFSQTQWTSCKRCSLEWAAPTGTQPCTVFGYKDFCGSTVLGTPESVGTNGQIDWQAQQISHLVCSLAGQRCSEAWGTFSTRTSQSITALTAWRKEEWRKEAADIPPYKVDNDLCSTRQILVLFRGQPWGDCWETGRSAYGPFRALRCHLELKLKLNWNFHPAWLWIPTRLFPCDWAVHVDQDAIWLVVGFDEHLYFCIVHGSVSRFSGSTVS